MSEERYLPKGYALEEILRAYFLRAGFFVIRGVPFRIADEDLTDVDLWLYERPTGASRRVQICDIKYKQKPKAVERIFWTRGLVSALGVDGAYVATTDSRPSIRYLAQKLDIQIIDGNDISKIKDSDVIGSTNRISDEELLRELKDADLLIKGKQLQNIRLDIIMAVAQGFGAGTIVRALEIFSNISAIVISHHPNSPIVRVAARLCYLAAALVCISVDYVSVSRAFRSSEEQRKLILDAVRLGALSDDEGRQTLKMAIALVERYAPGGKAAARGMESALRDELSRIPAEIIADQALKFSRVDHLFIIGRELEAAAYNSVLPVFDMLNTATKSMLGAILDYAGIDREKFATAWLHGQVSSGGSDHVNINTEHDQPGLFSKQ